MIYLDNAATSFPKPRRVIDAVNNYVKRYCGNPGRSGNFLSIYAAERVYECREAVAKLLDFPSPENIAFTQNATHALNIAIKGYIRDNCHCIISDLEHNSVLRPLRSVLDRFGGGYSVYDTDIPPELAIPPLIRKNTKLIISTLASNVTGRCIDIQALSRVASEHNLGLILDASQYLGHRALSLRNVKFDMLCAPGHKALFGLQGSGFVLFKNKELLPTLMEGGSGGNTTDPYMPEILPERYEAGTLNTPAIVGLNEGISFLFDYGMFNVTRYIDDLTERLRDILSSLGDRIEILGINNGIAAFNIKGVDSSEVERRLNERELYVRAGLHCSPLVHEKLGTLKSGAVRVSVSVLTKNAELDGLYSALTKMI